MKQFVDELIRRLEERISENRGWEEDEYFDGQSNAFRWAIEIVNELYKQYKPIPDQWREKIENKFNEVV